MSKPDLQPQSLKTRVTLMTLLIVILCFWTLAFFSNRVFLRDEIRLFAGEQQRSALNLWVYEINRNLQTRLDALDLVIKRAGTTFVSNPAAFHASLQEHLFMAGFFNAGLRVWDKQGILQANVQYSQPEFPALGLNKSELATVLNEGRTLISGVRPYGEAQIRAFAVAVPIRNTQGAIVGAIAGVIRLDQTNFLTDIIKLDYGKSGHLFLVESAQRLIFATSDQSRLLEVLPDAGVSQCVDSFVQGFEGTTQLVNPHGEEVLVSVQQIPLAHWYATVTLPTDEAFAMIKTLRWRIWPAAFVTLLLCGVLIWLMLRRELTPMLTAVNILDGYVRRNQAPQALPVVRQDEVGQLVGGFNRLLETLGQQQKVLHESELFKQAVLNSMTAEIAVLDQDGVILAVNEAWERFALENTASELVQNPSHTGVGANYLAAREQSDFEPDNTEALQARQGIRAVLNGHLPQFYVEYPCHTPHRQRWFSMSVTPLVRGSQNGAVVAQQDITERVQMQNQVRELAFYDMLTHLPNRRLALERLTQQMARARRTHKHLALLFIDLDKFKPINDELGHEVGDWLLQTVAQRILRCLRESDTAARMGGDEFVVLLPDLLDSGQAMMVAEKIRSSLEQEFVTDQAAVLNISSSIGVAMYPDHGADEKELMRLGDEAMYKVKKSGRNAVYLFQPSLAETETAPVEPATSSYVHLRWKAAFSSGNPQIDQEHEMMFELANTLLDQVALRHEHPQEFDRAYQALFTHVEDHFAHEEKILQELGFERWAAHAQKHQALLAQARCLYQELNESTPLADTEGRWVKFMAADLIAGHLLLADREFFHLFTKPV